MVQKRSVYVSSAFFILTNRIYPYLSPAKAKNIKTI